MAPWSLPWPVLVEQCFHALDQDRIEFHNPTDEAPDLKVVLMTWC